MTTNIETDLKEILLEIKSDIKELKKDVSEIKTDVAVLKTNQTNIKENQKELQGSIKDIRNKQDIVINDVADLKGTKALIIPIIVAVITSITTLLIRAIPLN